MTLRGSRDGKLLARVVERDGLLFVLDFGDPAVMTDASRRVLHGGFTVEWQGRTETAVPSTPALLRQVALYYAAQGVLVFVDEPDYPRAAPVIGEQGASLRPLALTVNLPTLLPDEPWDGDGNTQLRTRRELQELVERLDATLNTGPQMPYAEVQLDEVDDDGDDEPVSLGRTDEQPTEEVSRLGVSSRDRG